MGSAGDDAPPVPGRSDAYRAPLPETGDYGSAMGRILRRRRAYIFPPACKETFADAGADDMPGISFRNAAGTARGMAHPLEGSARISDRGAAVVPQDAGNTGFYEYYRIGRKDKSLPVRDEPPHKSRKGELRTVYESSHSPFGIVWQIASATGWTLHYILWKVNFQTLAMMLADAPHYETLPAKRTGVTSPEESPDTAQLFQSKLNL